MADVHDPILDEPAAYRWVVRVLYTGLIAANLWIAYDWWRGTPEGAAVLERWRAKIAEAKAKAENCEGCARRKAKLQAAANRLHFDAIRAVEGEEIETVPDVEYPVES